MGFLEDLAKTVREALEEAQSQGRAPRPQARSLPPPAEDVDPVDQAESKPVPAPRPQRTVQDVARVLVERQASTRTKAQSQAQAQAQERAQEARAMQRPKPPVPAVRLARLMRQPETVRELFLLRELLDPPLSLRPRRRF